MTVNSGRHTPSAPAVDGSPLSHLHRPLLANPDMSAGTEWSDWTTSMRQPIEASSSAAPVYDRNPNCYRNRGIGLLFCGNNMQEEDAQGRSGAISRRSVTHELTNSTSSTNSQEKRWFAHVQGQNYGPYTELEIRRMAENNQIVATDFLCPKGGSAWTEAKDEPQLGVLFQSDAQGAVRPAASTAHAGTGVQAADCGPTSKKRRYDYRALFQRTDQDQV